MIIFLLLLFPSGHATTFAQHQTFLVQLDPHRPVSEWRPRLERLMALDPGHWWTYSARTFAPGDGLTRDVLPALSEAIATTAKNRRTHFDLVIVGHGSPVVVGRQSTHHERVDTVVPALARALAKAELGTSVRIFLDFCCAGAFWTEFRNAAAELPIDVRGVIATSGRGKTRGRNFQRSLDQSIAILEALHQTGLTPATEFDDLFQTVTNLIGAYAEESHDDDLMRARRTTPRAHVKDATVIRALVKLYARNVFDPNFDPRTRFTAGRAEQDLEAAVTNPRNERLRRGLRRIKGDLGVLSDLLRLRASLEHDRPGDVDTLERLTEHPVEPIRADAVDIFVMYADRVGLDALVAAYWKERRRPDASIRILRRITEDVELFAKTQPDAAKIIADAKQKCEANLL